VIVRARQGDTVDALCQRVHGRTAGLTETVYAANPGLADLGPILPNGTAVELPDTAAAVTTETATVQLWS
jgi:phage tail protein X